MAGSIRVEMNRDGIISALKHPSVMADLTRRANQVAAAARSSSGGAYMVTGRTGKTRARVSVITANDKARRAESIDRALTRALDAARGG